MIWVLSILACHHSSEWHCTNRSQVYVDISYINSMGIKFTWIFPNSDKMLYQNCKHFTILTYLEAPSCAHLKDIATRELPHKFRRHGVQHTVGHLKKKTRRWKYWRWIWRSLDIRCGMPLMFHAWNMYLLYEHILNDSLIPYNTCSKK